MDTFTLDLAGNFGPTATLDAFALKFQSDINTFPNRFELPRRTCVGHARACHPILLGLGLGAQGLYGGLRARP